MPKLNSSIQASASYSEETTRKLIRDSERQVAGQQDQVEAAGARRAAGALLTCAYSAGRGMSSTGSEHAAAGRPRVGRHRRYAGRGRLVNGHQGLDHGRGLRTVARHVAQQLG
jgi:hypothetical protein